MTTTERAVNMASASDKHSIEGNMVRSGRFSETTFFSNYRPADVQDANLYEVCKSSTVGEGRAFVLGGSVRYQAYMIALYRVIEEWWKTKEFPDSEKEYIRNMNRKLKYYDQNVDLEEDVLHAYNKLKSYNIIGHLEIVCSHRLWIYKVYDLLKTIGVSFEPKVLEHVERHDLSKFGHKEACLGYAIMFGDGKG